LWAFHRGLRVRASVHLGGPSSLAVMVRRMAAGFGLDSSDTATFERWVEAFTGQPLAALELDTLKDGLRHPGLIIHDPDDRTVPFAAAEALKQRWPQAQLVRADGLGHRRLLWDPATIRRCRDFIATVPGPQMASSA